MVRLNVPCFRYFSQDFYAPLTVEEPADGGDLRVWCPVRQQLFHLNPEERVRQALVWFLKEGGNRAPVLKQRLVIGVEEKSLDVAGFFCGDALDQRFCPNVTVVIIETKRQDRDLTDADEDQLKSYMIRDRCRSGLLFNGRTAIWFTMDGDFAYPEWAKEILTDFCEIEEKIERESLAAHTFLTDCRTVFTDATRGNFDSLSRLVSLFGEDRSLTFVLSVRMRGKLTSFQAFSLRAEGPALITYWARGVVSRRRLQLPRQDFYALVTVRPI